MTKAKPKPKVIVIVGPTASGKSDLAVKLAVWLNLKKNRQKFSLAGAEIISADSRQIYRGLNIGSGKVEPDYSYPKKGGENIFIHQGVVHHCLDIASPKRRFTAADYKKAAEKALQKIIRQKKIPLICGGSGFYIRAVADNLALPPTKPDPVLRKSLERLAAEQLFDRLKKLDSVRAGAIDRHNKRRLIRALEIVLKTKKPVPPLTSQKRLYKFLRLGVKKKPAELKKSIRKRLLKRLEAGLISEVRSLHRRGLTWKRLDELGLEYRFVSHYLQKKISYSQMVERLQKEIEDYAGRQLTWLKKEKGLCWIRSCKEAKKLVNKFLQN